MVIDFEDVDLLCALTILSAIGSETYDNTPCQARITTFYILVPHLQRLSYTPRSDHLSFESPQDVRTTN